MPSQQFQSAESPTGWSMSSGRAAQPVAHQNAHPIKIVPEAPLSVPRMSSGRRYGPPSEVRYAAVLPAAARSFSSSARLRGTPQR